jgi:predicted RNA binding protein YcfA (HicA-like mRNA interferase family)
MNTTVTYTTARNLTKAVKTNQIKRDWKTSEFMDLLKKNGYKCDRIKGSHQIWKNENKTFNKSITITSNHLKNVIIRRLIKENDLVVN